MDEWAFEGTTLCFGIDEWAFEGTDLCTPFTGFLIPGVEDLFPVCLTGIFGGKPFGPTGRPGPFPLLLPSCFLESADVVLGLLVELGL